MCNQKLQKNMNYYIEIRKTGWLPLLSGLTCLSAIKLLSNYLLQHKIY